MARLSILRSATAPDANQDQGEHRFSFAIMPHPGRMVESGVIDSARRYTNEVYVRTTSGVHSVLESTRFSIRGDQAAGIVFDTIKRGEDDEPKGERTVILRMYESLGGRAKGTVNLYVSSASCRQRAEQSDEASNRLP
jgi:alpha-mannosidase